MEINTGFISVGQFLIWITLMAIGGILWEIYKLIKEERTKNGK